MALLVTGLVFACAAPFESAAAYDVEGFGSARGPATVHPGHLVRFRADGFLPAREVRVVVQPRSCLGSNGCYAGVPRSWRTDATGSVVTRFRFPKRYGLCTGVGCTEYRRFRKGTYAQVQICDQQSAEGEGKTYVACTVKMVRIGGVRRLARRTEEYAAKPSMALGRSMAGVRLGDSLARLHQVLGEPKAVHHVANQITGTERIDIYGRLAFGSFPSPGAEGVVMYMQTTRRSIRTGSGIGVGTRKRRLERELPSMSCYGHICSVVDGGGPQTIGKRVTSFWMHNRRVKVVSIGRVID